MDRIEKIIDEKRIILFMNGNASAPKCWFSMVAIEILKMCNVEFRVIDVLVNPKLKEEIKCYSCWATFPQLFVDGRFIGGSHVLIEMYQSRNLQMLFCEKTKKA